MISIRVTNKCNMNCGYCFYRNEFIENDNYNFDTLIRFLDETTESTYGITGGEPLLYNNIEKLTAILSKKGKVILFTNGMLLKKYNKMIIDNNVIVQVSLDSIGEQISNHHLYKSLIVEEILKLKNQGTRVVISYTITRDNISNAHDIFTYARANDIELSIGLLGFCPEKEIQLSQIKKVEEIYLENNDILHSYMVDMFYGDKKKYPSVCRNSKENLFIDYDGKIYDCYHARRFLGTINDSYDEVVRKQKNIKCEYNCFNPACITLF